MVFPATTATAIRACTHTHTHTHTHLNSLVHTLACPLPHAQAITSWRSAADGASARSAWRQKPRRDCGRDCACRKRA
eukprot:6177023-Pleurochrysis_carterae.AAC.2